MKREDCQVGMLVSFGRERGAKTRGKVIKLNDKKAKVQTLEPRGQASVAGAVWSVPYSMLTVCADVPEPPPYPNGLSITGVRYLTASECRDAGWDIGPHDAAVCITLSDGSILFASQDYEGNGPGAMFGRMRTGEQFILSPSQRTANESAGCV